MNFSVLTISQISFQGIKTLTITHSSHPTDNIHGRQVLYIFDIKYLHYIGPDFFTYYSGGRKGRPDFVFGNRPPLVYPTHLHLGPNIGLDIIPTFNFFSTTPILVQPNTVLSLQTIKLGAIQIKSIFLLT